MAFDATGPKAIGRGAAELLDLCHSLLAVVGESAPIGVLTAGDSPVTARDDATPRLFDASAVIPAPRRDDESGWKPRASVWTRRYAQIAEGHFFSTFSEAECLLRHRFAEGVERLNLRGTDVLSDFRAAANVEGVDPELTSLWKLIACVVPEHERTRPVMDPIQGAKRFFEERFLDHVCRTARELGMPTGRTSDAIKMYVHGKLSRQETGYPAWTLVYVAIRCGDYRAATEFAASAAFPSGSRCESPEYYLRTLMQRPAYVACRRFVELEQACLRFMRQGARKKLSSAYRYMLMSVAFLCGQIHVADTLIAESAQCWDSLDEFLWFSLGCVRPGTGATMPFDYKRLQTRLAAYEEAYYTENGRRPARYALVLSSALQFGSAMYYLVTQTVGHPYILHVVHMAIALNHHKLLTLPEVTDPKQMRPEEVAEVVLHYGHSLAASKSPMAWHYYILSHTLKQEEQGTTPEIMAQALVDLITKSEDPSILEEGSVLTRYVESAEERQTMFAKAAEMCEKQGCYEFAARLYHKAELEDSAVKACHRLMVRSLVRCGEIEGSAQKEERAHCLQVVERCVSYVQWTLEGLTAETEILQKVGLILRTDDTAPTQTLERVHALGFFPENENEIARMTEKLTNTAPAAVPLIPYVVRIYCGAVKGLSLEQRTSHAKYLRPQTLAALYEFGRAVSRTAADRRCIETEVKGTMEFLRHV